MPMMHSYDSGCSSPTIKSDGCLSAAASPRLRHVRVSKTGSAEFLLQADAKYPSPPASQGSVPRVTPPNPAPCLGSSRLGPAELVQALEAPNVELGRASLGTAASGPSLTTLIDQQGHPASRAQCNPAPSRLGAPTNLSSSLRLLDEAAPTLAASAEPPPTHHTTCGSSQGAPAASFSFPNSLLQSVILSPSSQPRTPCASPTASPNVSGLLCMLPDMPPSPADKSQANAELTNTQGLQGASPWAGRLPRVSMPNLSDIEPCATRAARNSVLDIASNSLSPMASKADLPSCSTLLTPTPHPGGARDLHRSGSLQLAPSRQLVPHGSFPRIRAHRSRTSWNGSAAQNQPSDLNSCGSAVCEAPSRSRIRLTSTSATGARCSPLATRGVSPEGRQDEVRQPTTGLHALLDALRDHRGGRRRQRVSLSGNGAACGGGNARALPKLQSPTGKALHSVPSSDGGRLDVATHRTQPEVCTAPALPSLSMPPVHRPTCNQPWALHHLAQHHR